MDRFWSGVAGEIPDTGAVPRPPVQNHLDASRGLLLEEAADLDEGNETGIFADDLESAMDDIACDVTRVWTARKASR